MMKKIFLFASFTLLFAVLLVRLPSWAVEAPAVADLCALVRSEDLPIADAWDILKEELKANVRVMQANDLRVAELQGQYADDQVPLAKIAPEAQSVIEAYHGAIARTAELSTVARCLHTLEK